MLFEKLSTSLKEGQVVHLVIARAGDKLRVSVLPPEDCNIKPLSVLESAPILDAELPEVLCEFIVTERTLAAEKERIKVESDATKDKIKKEADKAVKEAKAEADKRKKSGGVIEAPKVENPEPDLFSTSGTADSEQQEAA